MSSGDATLKIVIEEGPSRGPSGGIIPPGSRSGGYSGMSGPSNRGASTSARAKSWEDDIAQAATATKKQFDTAQAVAKKSHDERIAAVATRRAAIGEQAANAGTTLANVAGAGGLVNGASVIAGAAGAGPVGVAIAAFTMAVTGAATVIKKTYDVLGENVATLSQYSGPVASASANTQMRQEMAMIRRGERIGSQLGKYEEVRSKIEEKISDTMTEMLHELLKIAEMTAPVIEFCLKNVDPKVAADLILTGLVNIGTQSQLGSGISILKKLLGVTQESLEEQRKRENDNVLGDFDSLLGSGMPQLPKQGSRKADPAPNRYHRYGKNSGGL